MKRITQPVNIHWSVLQKSLLLLHHRQSLQYSLQQSPFEFPRFATNTSLDKWLPLCNISYCKISQCNLIIVAIAIILKAFVARKPCTTRKKPTLVGFFERFWESDRTVIKLKFPFVIWIIQGGANRS